MLLFSFQHFIWIFLLLFLHVLIFALFLIEIKFIRSLRLVDDLIFCKIHIIIFLNINVVFIVIVLNEDKIGFLFIFYWQIFNFQNDLFLIDIFIQIQILYYFRINFRFLIFSVAFCLRLWRFYTRFVEFCVDLFFRSFSWKFWVIQEITFFEIV